MRTVSGESNSTHEQGYMTIDQLQLLSIAFNVDYYENKFWCEQIPIFTWNNTSKFIFWYEKEGKLFIQKWRLSIKYRTFEIALVEIHRDNDECLARAGSSLGGAVRFVYFERLKAISGY